MERFFVRSQFQHVPEHRHGPATPLEGESLLAACRGEEWNRERPIFWEHEGNRAVRVGQWKAVSKYPGDWELYDMVEDRTELVDLAERNRPRRDEMVGAYGEWAERVKVVDWDVQRARMREAWMRPPRPRNERGA